MTDSNRSRRHVRSWAQLKDSQLLEVRLCDLGLRVENTPFPRRMKRLHDELAGRGLRFRPHYWLSDDWFSPDGVPGIAIPFYLAHPRLAKLEQRQMYEVEGGTEPWCMQLLRHEAGHAIDSAFRLHRRTLWRRHFGSFSRPYPDYYRVKPLSRSFVHHLHSWYAQSHPAEDFAETFAVWLRPGRQWKRRYADWPVLRKLEYVDNLMTEIAGTTAPVRTRRHHHPLKKITTTLREHYEKKRAHYGSGHATISDRALARLFVKNGERRSAAAFLRRARGQLRSVVARGTGEHPYTIDQILNEMIGRCRELGLQIDRPEEQVRMEAAVLLSVRTMGYLQASGRNWIAL